VKNDNEQHDSERALLSLDNDAAESPKQSSKLTGKSAVAAKLPAIFVFIVAIQPLVFLLFETSSPPALFTRWQVWAGLFLLIAYLAAVFSRHHPVARLIAVIIALLMLHPAISLILFLLLGSMLPGDPNFLYYASNYLAIAAVILYLRASGYHHKHLYLTGFNLRKSFWLIAVFSFLTIIVLVAYFHFAGHKLNITGQDGFPLVLASPLLFSLANGAMEELWFRSLMLGVLSRAFPLGFSVLYQALLFGMIHYEGVPAGATGIALSFIFGLVLGWLTIKTRSVVPAILIHIIADFAVALYV